MNDIDFWHSVSGDKSTDIIINIMNKMKKKKYHTVRTIPKSNIKMVERGKIDTLTHKIDTLTHKIDTLTHKIDTLTHKIDTLTHKIDTLTHKIDTLTHKIDTLTHKIDTPNTQNRYP